MFSLLFFGDLKRLRDIGLVSEVWFLSSTALIHCFTQRERKRVRNLIYIEIRFLIIAVDKMCLFSKSFVWMRETLKNSVILVLKPLF